jgi:ribosomal protein L37AE/L43A
MEVANFSGSKRLIATIREISLESTEWRQIEDFVCKSQKHPAVAHPDDNRVWACQQCRLVTDCPSIYFEHVQ